MPWKDEYSLIYFIDENGVGLDEYGIEFDDSVVKNELQTFASSYYYETDTDHLYDVIEYIEGHYYATGKDANIMKNPIWRVKEKESGKEILLMYCEKDTICKLCSVSYKKILDYEKNQNKKLLIINPFC